MDRKENTVQLRIRPTQTPMEQAIKQDREAKLNELQTTLRAVHDLSNTPGWQVFLNELKNERLDLLERLLVSNDPTTLAKVAGSLVVVERFSNWISIMKQDLESAAQAMAPDDEE